MGKFIRRLPGLLLMMLLLPVPALSQSFEQIEGEWFATPHPSVKLGIVRQRQDAHPHFVMAECSERLPFQGGKKYGRISFEIDPKLYAKAIASDRHVIVRVAGAGRSADYQVAAIRAMDFAAFA